MLTNGIFRPGNGLGNACAGGWFENDTCRALEFQGMADAEIERTLAAGGFFQPPRFHAICFNYRHALELQLKEIVRDADKAIHLEHRCGSLMPERLTAVGRLPRKQLTRIHRLGELLDHIVPRLRVLDAPDLPASVRSLVAEFDDLDSHGQTFRYAHDTQGTPTMPEQRHFDLPRIRDAVSEAMEELGRAHNWACITSQLCQEYLSDIDEW